MHLKWRIGNTLLKLARVLDKISLAFGHWEQDLTFHGYRLLREHYDKLEERGGCK